MVIRSLIAEPSGRPSFTNRRRSLGFKVMRLGKRSRKIRFSAFRNSRYLASCLSVAEARSRKKALRAVRMAKGRFGLRNRGNDRVFDQRRTADETAAGLDRPPGGAAGALRPAKVRGS